MRCIGLAEEEVSELPLVATLAGSKSPEVNDLLHLEERAGRDLAPAALEVASKQVSAE
jgi:hypothetical protein